MRTPLWRAAKWRKHADFLGEALGFRTQGMQHLDRVTHTAAVHLIDGVRIDVFARCVRSFAGHEFLSLKRGDELRCWGNFLLLKVLQSGLQAMEESLAGELHRFQKTDFPIFDNSKQAMRPPQVEESPRVFHMTASCMKSACDGKCTHLGTTRAKVQRLRRVVRTTDF